MHLFKSTFSPFGRQHEGGMGADTERMIKYVLALRYSDSYRIAQRTRAHFYPQHWLLCHLGLY